MAGLDRTTIPPGSSEAHTALVNSAMIWLSAHGALPLQNKTGAMLTGDGFVRFGTPGSSDIVCCWKPAGGRFLAVECKTGRAVLSPKQRKFKAAVLRAGGIHVTCRSIEQLARDLGQ